jgi:16S rRNA (guanine527-N7)-methyltransferase
MTSPRVPPAPPADRPGAATPAATAGHRTAADAIHLLRSAARDSLALNLSDRHLEAFAWYLEELLRWNERHNLTAVVDPAGIVLKHFLDSLTLLPRLGANPAGPLVDVGTGAGFPGLPLRIVSPGLRLVLVEATAKKAEFCRHVVDGLGLRGVEVIHARAEEIGQAAPHRQRYEAATARAVASLPVLLEYLLPLVRVGGRVLAQKGENGPAEAQESQRALEILGGRLQQLHLVELPGIAEIRTIIEVEKIAATPEAYPRRPGIPAKRPLMGEAAG